MAKLQNNAAVSSELLSGIGQQLRILSIEETTKAGSGHPTSCCSAADLVAALFFGEMRFDPENPHNKTNDRFILSKGHAAPLLYAAWGETGHVTKEQIMTLRQLNSPFEGHPTPRLDFVDLATGSLGQGLTAGVGMAVNAKMDGLDYRTYVVMGDGECAEGSVWEAASLAGIRELNNLVAIVDCNRLGQSQETAFGHDLDVYRNRFQAFGWNSIEIDGHNMGEILRAFEMARESFKPFAIIARTIKGKGIPGVEDQLNWHGKPLPQDKAQEAIAYLKPTAKSAIGVAIRKPTDTAPIQRPEVPLAAPNYYEAGKKVATRKAYGHALARIGAANARIVALDGDVENSTYSLEFNNKFPDRFVECYIAEQNIVGVSVGLSALGKIPFASTFAAFYSRAYDQIRMAAVSFANLKLCGSHCGVSIGEDGPSQMGLEDLAMMRAVHGSTVFYPSDAISTERLVEKMANEKGIFYLRTSRPETQILYSLDEKFERGGAKILRQSEQDQVTVIGAGITVFEALAAADELKKRGISIRVIDCYSIKPIARDLILASARKTGDQVITVEDHYPEGGLGDAVAGELSREGVRVHKLAVYDLPHSGTERELLQKFGIDSTAIVRKVEKLAGLKRSAA
jgi:transketolase